MSATPSLSQYHIAQLLNASARGITFTPAAALYMSLYITSPGPLNTGTEVSAGIGYARHVITFSAPTFGLITKGTLVNDNAEFNFGASTASWNPGGGGSIGFMGLHDASGIGTGNLLWYGPLDSPGIVSAAGQTISITPGSITLLMG